MHVFEKGKGKRESPSMGKADQVRELYLPGLPFTRGFLGTASSMIVAEAFSARDSGFHLDVGWLLRD